MSVVVKINMQMFPEGGVNHIYHKLHEGKGVGVCVIDFCLKVRRQKVSALHPLERKLE